MVDIQRNASGQRCRFVLRPNRSLSWRGALIFFFSLCVVSGSIAVGWALLGFWMVLPFAGLEMLLVGAGLYLVACRSHECEVIFITADSIQIEKGRRYPRQRWAFARVWARVSLERCPSGWYPSRLLICSQGRAVEVGRFLNEEERQCLAAELTRSI